MKRLSVCFPYAILSRLGSIIAFILYSLQALAAQPMPPLTVVLDCSQAPETAEWAETAADIARQQYPFLVAALDSEGFVPADSLKIAFKHMEGVAYASRGTVTISAEWIKQHPDDLGMVVHEMIHVIQAYRGSRTNRVPGWITEGITDYLRFFFYERNGERTCRVNVEKAKYTDSYRTTAAFFDWIVRTVDAGFIKKMNAACRNGRYSVELFKDFTGMTVDELWEKFIDSLKMTANDADKTVYIGFPDNAPFNYCRSEARPSVHPSAQASLTGKKRG